MDLTKEEIQFLITTVDAYVRANGLNGVATAMMVASKLQNQAKSMADAETPVEATKGTDGAK